ncbi:MAG: FAD-dependent oxidoreductase [Advenella sp.]|uniref:NAD(P)/FAD-dependent oxidoreductase n=1 Tax=Advenella sp. TaxID=1872388 RepID=UPI0025848419|nr:FAD-dependent oxidoreductase [Advenella sp.]MDD3757509.1 FAD-dependent oxidoreductase [Advenella sp.]
MIKSIVIIGAGLAGATAARALRAQGYQGRIHLVGEELHAAYDRPCLSKGALTGTIAEPPMILDADWYVSADIDLYTGTRVISIDGDNRQVHFEFGEILNYDRLLLATGANARRLAITGSDLAGIFTLRSRNDSQVLKQSLGLGRSLVIIGGGLIGCEVATTAIKAGVNVTILEAGDELLLRVLGRRTGSWCRNELERSGVRIELNTQVSHFEGEGHVKAVVCADGRRIEADTVLVSIGSEPADELARSAGILCARGVVVDATGASSCPGVFAAGDVAAWPVESGPPRSLETYLNSVMQAETVATAMLGTATPAVQVSTSWTEIAGHRIQMIGNIEGPGEIVLRGSFDNGQPLVLFRVFDGRVEAATAINTPKDFSIATRMLANRTPVSTEELQDVSHNLRSLLKPEVMTLV